jgi:small subunit ribosomal protein S16
MLKIKLTRIGKRNQPRYRIVVDEARSKNRGGNAVATLGHYNPMDPENRLVINSDLYKVWLEKGAQPTQTVRQLVAKLS